MSLLDRLFRRKKEPAAPTEPAESTPPPAAVQQRAGDFNEVLLSIGWGGKSISGANVSSESALTYAAVLACVRVLAESVASLPLITYRRTGNGGKERAYTHPLYSLLHDAPNPDMTSFQWRETEMTHLTLWGNAYNEIVLDGAGRVRELWPLQPQWMTVKRENDRLIYEYREPSKKPIPYPAESILHIAGLSMNGLIGMTMIALYRETIGLGLTLNEYGGLTFANGTRAGGVLEVPGVMSDEAYKRLKGSFEQQYGGLENAGKTILLEEGTKFNKISMPNDDAQYLESKKFQAIEVARMFRVPPHKIGILDNATFSNIEHQGIEFVTDTLRPWLVRWEQEIMRRLFLPAERDRYFSEHLVDGLLRGDTPSRYAAYATGRQWGWLSVNDVRALENMNAIDGGDTYLSPLNMSPVAAAHAEGHSGNGTREKVREVEG
jgi:HK97 family phage portal protein